ncbi:hypothetical protein [Mesorhizobium sp. WSM2561]|nr:hypothetical protein [Mesorhizobium sp. WSM2561]
MAKRTLDDAKRELSELSEIVFNDVALIPMRADQYTLAMKAKT